MSQKRKNEGSKNKAVIWCRGDTSADQNSDVKLEEKLAFLRQYANEEGLSVEKEFKVLTGSSFVKQADTFKEMMDYVKEHGIHRIITDRFDRMTRKPYRMLKADNWIKKSKRNKICFVHDDFAMHQSADSKLKMQWDIHSALLRAEKQAEFAVAS